MFARFFDDPLHLIVLLVVILIIFGAGKLPGVGAALGQSVREFKKATVEDDAHPTPATASVNTCAKCAAAIPAGAQFCPACGAPARTQIPAEAAAGSAAVFCPSCGAKNEASARFCAQCGSSMGVHVS
jgi:sec-independent protein translocase protein TatA